jgi:hypothetical protein
MDFESDFVEVKFADADTATEAERHFPTSVVNTGDCLSIRTREWETLGPRIEEKLVAGGFRFDVRESSLTEEDMWPDEEDEDDLDEVSEPRM